MILTHFYDMKKDCFTNSIKWNDENSAKAFMFDLLMNKEYEFAKIEIDEIDDNEYTICFLENETFAKGGFIEIDYRRD